MKLSTLVSFISFTGQLLCPKHSPHGLGDIFLNALGFRKDKKHARALPVKGLKSGYYFCLCFLPLIHSTGEKTKAPTM